jgi:hypothetical protein
MKVVCIYNKGWIHHLTIGKIYDVIRINDYGLYCIINDKGNIDWFYKKHFKSLSEYRIEKINKLLLGL